VSGSFPYAQARLQARHAARPGSALWIRLEASRTLGHYLESARGSVLEAWLSGLHAGSGVHEIEPSLRRAFRRYVGQVASWLPERWQPSVAWTAELAELPTRADQDDALTEWRRRFHELSPPATPAQRRGLELLADRIEGFRNDLLAAERSQPDADAGEHDRALEHALIRLFRRQTEQPAAALCHLALTALDVERLRGGLVGRALFEPEGSAG
jgi:phytoene dehydrogenase-like protein